MRVGDVDWDDLFGRQGARWFHTGGIFAGLSETTPEVVEEAMLAARRHGTLVSYDLNYRPSLWRSFGGVERAQEVNQKLVRNVDVLIGNEEDFTAALGFEVPDTDASLSALQVDNFATMVGEVSKEFRDVKVVATTLRDVRTASVNDWSAIAWVDGEVIQSIERPGLEILDRVGGGDSFAAGLIYGLLEKGDVRAGVEYGAAHGALAMTTPGDTSMASLDEVEALMRGSGARVQR